MNLYLVKRTDNWDYDEYDAFVVVAETEDAARRMHPSGPVWDEESASWRDNKHKFGSYTGGWTKAIEALKVELLGAAKEGSEAGVVLASFHAG